MRVRAPPIFLFFAAGLNNSSISIIIRYGSLIELGCLSSKVIRISLRIYEFLRAFVIKA